MQSSTAKVAPAHADQVTNTKGPPFSTPYSMIILFQNTFDSSAWAGQVTGQVTRSVHESGDHEVIMG